MKLKRFSALFFAVFILAGILAGCDANKKPYGDAEALLSEGKYAEAAAAFEALGEYKDSAAKAEDSRVKYEDSLYTFITVEKIPQYFQDIDCTFTDGSGGQIIMPPDIDDWFVNASFEGIHMLNGATVQFERDPSIVKEIYTDEDLILAEGSTLLFIFTVDGVSYSIPITPGAQIAVKEGEDGYTLGIDKTEGAEVLAEE